MPAPLTKAIVTGVLVLTQNGNITMLKLVVMFAGIEVLFAGWPINGNALVVPFMSA